MISHQDQLLEKLQSDKIPVSIYLVNGIRLQGIIEAQDRFTVLLKNEGVSQLVYKHAMTTILPSRPVMNIDNHEK